MNALQLARPSQRSQGFPRETGARVSAGSVSLIRGQAPFLIFFLLAGVDGPLGSDGISALQQLLRHPAVDGDPLLQRVLMESPANLARFEAGMAEKDIDIEVECLKLTEIINAALEPGAAQRLRSELHVFASMLECSLSGFFTTAAARRQLKQRMETLAFSLCVFRRRKPGPH